MTDVALAATEATEKEEERRSIERRQHTEATAEEGLEAGDEAFSLNEARTALGNDQQRHTSSGSILVVCFVELDCCSTICCQGIEQILCF